MSDFIDIIIRGQDLASGPLAKVAAELEAVKLASKDTGGSLDKLASDLGKLDSGAPNFTKLLNDLKKQQQEMDKTAASAAKLKKEIEAASKADLVTRDTSNLTDRQIANTRKAQAAVKDLRGDLKGLAADQKEAAKAVDQSVKNFGKGLKDLQTDTRNIASSLRREGLGPIGKLLDDLTRKMQESEFAVNRTQAQFDKLGKSINQLNRASPGLTKEFNRISKGMEDEYKNAFRLANQIEILQKKSSSFRNELEGLGRELNRSGSSIAGRELIQIAREQDDAFHTTARATALLTAKQRELELQGKRFSAEGKAVNDLLERMSTEEFKVAQAAETAAGKFGDLRTRLKDVSKEAELSGFVEGNRNLQEAELRMAEMDNPAKRLVANLSDIRAEAKQLGAEGLGINDKDFNHLITNVDKAGASIDAEGQKVSAAAANTRQFNRDVDGLRRTFSRLGAKNFISDLASIRNLVATSDLNVVKAHSDLNRAENEARSLFQGNEKALAQVSIAFAQAHSDLSRFKSDVESSRLQIQQLERDSEKIGRSFASAGFPILGAQLDKIGNSAFRSSEGLRRMAADTERLARQATGAGLENQANKFATIGLRLVTAADDAKRLENGLKSSFTSMEGFAARAERVGSKLGLVTSEMERLKAATNGGNSTFGIFIRTLTVWASRMAILVFAFTGLTGVIGPLVGTVGSLVGGVTSLVAAFSQLGSVLAGIPGALAAVGGSMLAIRSVLQPQGILTAVQGVIAAQKSQAGSVKSTGTAAGNPVRDARQTLHDAQQSLADAEQNLHDLRISDRQQEQDAELALQKARLDAAQANIQAERDLIAVRAQAKLQEDQLRADVQNAKASLSGLQQEGASPAAILQGRSEVRIAEAALTQQQITDAKDVGDAQQKVHDARVNGALAIQQAERALATTIRNNSRQERDAQESVAKSMRSVADAQKKVAEAMHGAGGSAVTFGNQLQRALFGLDPIARRLVFQILTLRTAFQGLTQGVRDRGYTVFSQFVSFLQSHLPQIVGVLNLFATAVTNVAEKFFHFVESPKVFSQIQELFIQSVPLVEKFGQALLPVIDAFIKIGVAAVPFTNFLANGLVKISQFFDKLTTSSIQSGSFAQFLNDSERTLTIVVHILEHFGGLIDNVFHAASASGQTLLQLFDNFLARLERITGTVAGQNALKKFFTDQIPVMQAVGNLLVSIGHGFIAVTEALNKGPTGRNTLIDFLNRLSTGFIPFLTEFLVKFSAGVGGAFVNLIAAFGNLALAMASLSAPGVVVINTLAGITNAVANLLTAVDTTFPALTNLVVSLGISLAVFSRLNAPLTGFFTALSFKSKALGDSLNLLYFRFKLLFIAIVALQELGVPLTGVLSSIFDAFASVGNAVTSFTDKFAFLQPVLDKAGFALKLFAGTLVGLFALDQVIGIMTAFGGAVSALLVKLGFMAGSSEVAFSATELLTIALQENTVAQNEAAAAALRNAAALGDEAAAAEIAAAASGEAAVATEKGAVKGGLLGKALQFVGKALQFLGTLVKTLVLPVLIVLSDTIIPAVTAAFVVLAGAIGLPVEAVAALVAGIAILSIGLITNLFGIRDKAISIAGDIVDFFKFQFGLLNDFFAAFHGDFSGLEKDAKTAAGKVKDFFVGAFHDLTGLFGGGGNEFGGLIQQAAAAARAQLAVQAHELGTTTVTRFLAGSATLSDKLPAQFRAAMELVKAQVQTDITALTARFQTASTAISAILGAATETKLTPAQAKLNRLQREDELAALRQQAAQAKTQAQKDAAARALEEFKLQGRAQREQAQQSTLNQIQSAGQQLSLQNLEKYLESTNVSSEAKFRALDTFLKKNHLTRADLMNQFGKTEGTKYFNALQKSLAPVRAMIKRLGTDVNVGLGLAGNSQLATPQPRQGHGPHSGLTDVTPGDARTLLLDRAKQLKISQQVVAQFGIIGKQAASGFLDGIDGGLAQSEKIISARIAHNVLEPFKKVLGIASPSKVFRKIGNDVVDGFILGIGSLRHKFAVLWAKVGSDAADFFTQMADFAKGKNGFGRFIHVMTQTVPATFPGIRNTMQKLWSGLLSDHDTFWDKMEKRLAKGWATIHDLFTKTIPGTYDTIATSVGALWTRLGQGVNKGWKYITNQLFSWESDLLDTMNLILNRVGSKKLDKIAKPAQPQNNAPTDFASGGVPFVGNNGQGIVRAVPGGVYRVAEAGQPEAIISLDRRHRNRSLQIIEYALKGLGIPGFASGGITQPGKAEPRFGGITVGDPPTFHKVSGIVKEIAVAAATLVKTAADKWFGSSIMGSVGGPVPTYSVPSSAHIQHNIALGQELAASKYGWTGNVFNALRSLWIGESGWNEFAYNRSSGAQGIPQFLPGLAGRPTPRGFPSNPPVDPKLQELWGMGYIHGRYNDPLTAFRLWLSRSPHWYHEGTPSVPGPKGADVPAMLQAGEMVLTQKHQALLGKLLFGNYMPNPPGAIGGGGGGGTIHGHFTEMAAYFKKLLAAVFKEVRGYLGAGSMPDFSIASGNFYSRTGLENGKGVIPIARRHMEFSHQMVRDVFNNSSYGLGAMLHELAHAFQLPSIIKRGKKWIEGGAELFMDRFGPSAFANLGPEHPAERREYHGMLEEVLKEKTLVKRTTTRLKDGSLTSAEKARLTKQLKREKNHLANLQDKAKSFLQDHPSANRKFHKILFHLAQAQVPAYERDLAGLRQEFDGDPSAVTKAQFHGGAAAALGKRLSLLDFQRLTKLNEIKTTKAEIARISATGTDASSQQVLANLQAILARLGVNVANLLRTEMAFMQAHPILRKQFPKLYRQLLGIDGGGSGSAGLPLPGPIGQPVLPSFRAGGEVTGYSRRFGDPVTIQAHVGEWVVNPEQQARLAATLGGWQEAKRFLFSTVTPDPMRSSFAVGGPIAGGRGAQAGHGTTVNQHVTINTASPKVDIDYVSRVLEARMGRF